MTHSMKRWMLAAVIATVEVEAADVIVLSDSGGADYVRVQAEGKA